MNDKSFRWYHYLMTSLVFQFSFLAVTACLALLQVLIYSDIDNDVQTFKDVCQVEMGGSDDDFLTELTCGDEIVDMETLTASYLHAVLTEERQPVIMCTKTLSEYMKTTKWACDMDPEDTST